MSQEPPDFWRSMHDYTNRGIDDQARFWKGYADLWSPPARDQKSQPASSPAAHVPADAARAFAERTSRFARDYATLTTRYYRSLFDLSRSYADAVAGEVFGYRAVMKAAAPAGAVMIVLEAVPDGEATASFVVENHRAEQMDVDLQVASFSGPKGAFDAEVALDPTRFTLASGEERRVTLSLAAKPDRFEAGGRYTATLVNRGDPDTRLIVEVRVAEAAPAPAAAKDE